MTTAFLVVALLAASPAQAPRNVYVGVHLNDVSDFDLKAGRFKADLTVWLKWLGDETTPALTFPNAELDSKDEVGSDAEGHWRSKQWRVQGTFRGDFPVHDFPFDRQTLRIAFALDSKLGALVPDLAASGMSPSFSVTGWNYQPSFSANVEDHVFGSDLGSIQHEGAHAHQRLVTYSVELARPFGPYLVKFALPLVLIVLVSLLALLLQPERLDVRSAMGITGLLSCIAFHYTQADTLPAVTYLVAADTLFLAAYVFITITLVLSVLAYRVHVARPGLARNADRAGMLLLPLSAIAGVWLAIAPALARTTEVEPPIAPNPYAEQPLAHVSVATLESPGAAGLGPLRRCALVTRMADGHFRPDLALEAPAMTNALVRLLPNGGMRVRWKLRQGATWSDGIAITSDDLRFSLELAPDPLRLAVEVVDERTLDVTYADRRREFLSGFTVFPLHAAAQVDGGREALSQAQSEGALPTCGPFVIESFERGAKLVLVRNARAVTTPAAIERIDVQAMAPTEAAGRLLDGGLDVVAALTPEAYELVKAAPGVRVLEQPGDQAWMLAPQLSRGVLADLRARQAVLGIIDRAAIVSALAPLPAYVTPGWRVAPSGALVAPPSLEAAGLKGAALTLTVPTIRSKDATHAIVAQQLMADFSRAGLQVTLVEKPSAELRQAVQQGTHEGLVLISRDADDPGRFMNVTSRALDTPVGTHFDRELVSRLSMFRASLYEERRDELELELQAAWFARLPMLPLFVSSRLAAVRSDLLGPDWGHADSLWWNVAQWRRAPNPVGAAP